MRVPLPLDRPFPERLRARGIQVLCGTFARAFDVEAPAVAALPADRALWAFREFSAACMEEALLSPDYAAARREDLERRARKLGARVRAALRPRDDELPRLLGTLYAAIGIDVACEAAAGAGGRVPAAAGGKLPDGLMFHRCYFAQRYAPGQCALMSAFDSGFVGGLCGGGRLCFSQRMTEGASCCRALLLDGGTRPEEDERNDAR